jgi:hypothetical protein
MKITKITKKCRNYYAYAQKLIKFILVMTQIYFKNVLSTILSWFGKRKYEHIDCSGCEGLKPIPNLPTDKILDCSNCDILKTISYIRYCKDLTKVPTIPTNEIKDCSDCKNLE